MKKLPMLALALFALALFALACGALVPGAHAQEKTPPIKTKDVQKTTYDDLLRQQQGSGSARFVSGDETITTGELVTLTRKGAGKLTGIFVYADPKTSTLYVRPKAGQPPVGIAERDIERIERIRPASTAAGQGGIRPAFDEGTKKDPTPEISSMTVRNGPYTSQFFYDNSLSTAERRQLQALESAGNAVVQKQRAVETLRESLQNAAAGPDVNVIQNGGAGYGSYGAYGYGSYVPAYPYYYPVTYYNLYYYLYYPILPTSGYGLPIGQTYGYDGVPFGASFPVTYGGGGNQTVVIRDSGSNANSVAALTKSLSEAEAALTESQKTYATLRQRAVLDPNGNIVAVRTEQ